MTEEDLIPLCQDTTQSDKIRVSACFELGQMKSKRAIPVLLKVGSEAEPESLIWESLNAVGSIGSKTATRPLMRLFRTTQSQATIRAAVYALWTLGDERAGSLLVKILLDPGHDPMTRGFAAEGLGMMRPSRSSEGALLKALEDPSGYLRISAICGLGALGLDSAVSALNRLLDDHSRPVGGEESVAEFAARALESIAEKNSTESRGLVSSLSERVRNRRTPRLRVVRTLNTPAWCHGTVRIF